VAQFRLSGQSQAWPLASKQARPKENKRARGCSSKLRASCFIGHRMQTKQIQGHRIENHKAKAVKFLGSKNEQAQKSQSISNLLQ